MSSQDIQALSDSLVVALHEAKLQAERVEFLERIIRQAILTNGPLKVDPALADAAKSNRKTIMVWGETIELA